MSSEKRAEDAYSDQQACFQATTQVRTKRVLPSHLQLPKMDLIGITIKPVSRLAPDMDLGKVSR